MIREFEWRFGTAAAVVKSIRGVCAPEGSVRGKVSGSEGVVSPSHRRLLLYHILLSPFEIALSFYPARLIARNIDLCNTISVIIENQLA